jgi:hypothetical protein
MYAERGDHMMQGCDAVDRVHTVRDQSTGRPAPQLSTLGLVRAARDSGRSVPCATCPEHLASPALICFERCTVRGGL